MELLVGLTARWRARVTNLLKADSKRRNVGYCGWSRDSTRWGCMTAKATTPASSAGTARWLRFSSMLKGNRDLRVALGLVVAVLFGVAAGGYLYVDASRLESQYQRQTDNKAK